MLKRNQYRKPASLRPLEEQAAPPEERQTTLDEVLLDGPRDSAVRLTRKYAEMIDGVNLADARVGDELTLSARDADVLIAEGWAERTSTERPRKSGKSS